MWYFLKKKTLPELLEEAQKEYGLGHFKEALSLCDKATKLDVNNDASFEMKASIYLLTDPQKALTNINKAISVSPKNHSYYETRGSIHNSLKNPAAAVEDFNKAIELTGSGNLDAYFGRGLAYLYLNDSSNALYDFDSIINIMPDYQVPNGSIYLIRAIAESIAGKIEEAIKDLNIVLQQENLDSGNKAKAHFLLANIKYDMGEIDAAIQECKTALTLSPGDREAMLFLEKISQKEKANQIIYSSKLTSLISYTTFSEKFDFLEEIPQDAWEKYMSAAILFLISICLEAKYSPIADDLLTSSKEQVPDILEEQLNLLKYVKKYNIKKIDHVFLFTIAEWILIKINKAIPEEKKAYFYNAIITYLFATFCSIFVSISISYADVFDKSDPIIKRLLTGLGNNE